MMDYKIGEWTVNPATHECSKNGETIRLEAKMMAVLEYFVQHRGQLISRVQLEDDIWGNTVVGYDAVTGCIAKLRKILGDNPKRPLYIETISKKGYRFIAEVAETQTLPASSEQSNNPGRKWDRRTIIYYLLTSLLVISGLFLFLPTINKSPTDTPSINPTQPSIVVLPFSNMSQDPGQAYFSDGIYADISTALSKLSGLLVIAPATAENYRDTSSTVTQNNLYRVAEELAVTYILQGSVRKDHNRVRINVNLIDARNKSLLWSEKYDRELNNLFEVQDDITAHIVNVLSITLTEEEKRNTAKRYTVNLSAYDKFLKGQALYIKHNREEILLAREVFQRAISLDKDFARAYSSLALTYIAEYRYGWGNKHPDLLKQALQYAQQAIERDQSLPQGYWVLAYVNLFLQDYEAAEKAAESSIRIAPNFADSYISLAVCKLHFNQVQQALKLVRQAMRINPYSPAAYASVLGQIYYVMKEYDSAIYALTDAIEKNINLLTPHVFLVAAQSRSNNMEEAQWNAEQIRIISPGFKPEDLRNLLVIKDESLIEELATELRSFGF